jgi:hypothetical protein
VFKHTDKIDLAFSVKGDCNEQTCTRVLSENILFSRRNELFQIEFFVWKWNMRQCL